MQRTDYEGFEQAAAISLNYALDCVEEEIKGELSSGKEVSPDTLVRLLTVIRRQRPSVRHAAPSLLQ